MKIAKFSSTIFFSFRYSAKVDPYIPSISVCLKDESLLVRKQTLTLLAHLLQVHVHVNTKS